jgi:beta-lactam-binding protein with PASTA domain
VTLKRLVTLVLLVAGAFALGVALANYLVLPHIIHRQQEVLVPDLTGVKVDDARAQVERLGLLFEVREEVYREGTPPGVVLEQQPRALRSVRKGRPLRAVVSKGESLAQAPDLSGMTLRQCEITLVREGLNLGSVARSFDPQGRLGVVAQHPRAGARAARGSRVDVLLREGHAPIYFKVPSLVGRSLQTVQEELLRAGFKIRRATYRRERGAAPGTILEQSPAAGSRIPVGGSLELVAASSG